MSEVWRYVQVKEIGEIITGTTPDTRNPSYWGEALPFLSPADFHGQKYVGESEKSLIDTGATHCRTLPTNAILVSCIGTIGKMAMASVPCVTNQQINAVVCSGGFSPSFVYYLLQQNVAAIFALSGTTTIPIVNKTQFGSIRLHVPPLSQQRKITRILTTLDNVIEKTEALIAKYQAIKQGLMHDLFTRGVDATGKLRPPQSEAPELYKQSGLGWIPKEWEVQELFSVADLITKGATPTTYGFHFVDEGVRFIRGENLSKDGQYSTGDRWITSDANNFLRRSRIERNDVILGIVGTLGNFTIAAADLLPANISQNVALIRCRSNELSAAFLAAFFQTREFAAQIAAEVTVQAQPSINLGQVGEFRVLCPAVEEQMLIVRHLAGINNKLNIETACQRKLRLLKTGLMQDLLTGKVRVNVEVGMENDEVEGGISGRKNAE